MEGNKMDMLGALSEGNRALNVLIALIEELNAYNAPDMLDGYLDALGTRFNTELDLLGLPNIEEVGNNE